MGFLNSLPQFPHKNFLVNTVHDQLAEHLVQMTSLVPQNVSTHIFISDPAISLTNRSSLFHFCACYVCIVRYKWTQARCYFIFMLLLNYDFSRVAPNLTFSNSAEAEFGRISELKFGRSRSRSRIWLKLVFWSQNNTPLIKLMAPTMLSAAIEAVHFSASFVALLFASYS